MGTQHANITEHGALTVEYLKSMQEKIKTSNRIPIEQVEKILRVSLEYAEATRRGPTPAQVWQKLESIVLMFCRVITAQVDYIIALVKDNYMMQVDKTLYRRVSH